MNDFAKEMEELTSAEEFLEFFGIAYDENVVRVNRLHILQRFHDYLRGEGLTTAHLDGTRVASLLRRAYEDFVTSDARTEKVFKVFRQQEASVSYIPVASLTRRPS